MFSFCGCREGWTTVLWEAASTPACLMGDHIQILGSHLLQTLGTRRQMLSCKGFLKLSFLFETLWPLLTLTGEPRGCIAKFLHFLDCSWQQDLGGIIGVGRMLSWVLISLGPVIATDGEPLCVRHYSLLIRTFLPRRQDTPNALDPY